MKIVGIIGGIASGKSVVARRLAELGAVVLDADRTGHEVLRLEEVRAAARERWGGVIFDRDGHIDRARLGALVFAPPPQGPEDRTFLESLTHPRIGRVILERIEASRAAGAPAVVLDVPLLVESGMQGLCDAVWFVEAPREQRLARAVTRGWSEAEFAAREATQGDLVAKRGVADDCIDNSGTLESTEAQVDQLWSRLIG